MKSVEEIMREELEEAIKRTMERATAQALPELTRVAQDAADGNAYAKRLMEDHSVLGDVGAQVGRIAGRLIGALTGNKAAAANGTVVKHSSAAQLAADAHKASRVSAQVAAPAIGAAAPARAAQIAAMGQEHILANDRLVKAHRDEAMAAIDRLFDEDDCPPKR